MTSVPSSSVRQLVNHKFAEDRYIPHNGEIISLSENLTGLGSTTLSLTDLPSRATPRNYPYAILLSSSIPVSGLKFIVFPVPTYSAMDPSSHLIGYVANPPTSNELASHCLSKKQTLLEERNHFFQLLLHLVSL
jgi:hypothetical protein